MFDGIQYRMKHAWLVYVSAVLAAMGLYVLWRSLSPESIFPGLLLVALTGAGGLALYAKQERRREPDAPVADAEPTGQFLRVYRALFEHFPDAAILLDPHGEDGRWRVVECNPAAAELTGYMREELIGQPIDILHVEPHDSISQLRDADRLRAGSGLQDQILHRHHDGSPVTVDMSAGLIHVNGREFVLEIDRAVGYWQTSQATLQHYSQAMLALNNAMIAITSTLQLDEVLQRVIESAMQVFPQALVVTMQLLDEAGERMKTVQASEGAFKTHNLVVFKPGVGIAGHAIAGKQVITVSDIRTDPRFIVGSHPPPFLSLLVAPLITSTRTWGTLSIEGREAGMFSRQDEILANLLARQAGVALEKAHLYEAEQQQRRIAETLRDIGLSLTGMLRQEDVLKQVLEQVGRVLPYHSASVWITDRSGTYHLFSWIGQVRSEQKLSGAGFINYWDFDQQPALSKVGITGEVVVIPDVHKSADWVSLGESSPVNSWAGAPIHVRGELIGALCLDHTTPGFYGPQHRLILEALATQVSMAVESALLFEQVEGHALNLQKQVMARTAEIRFQREQTETILSSIDDGVIITSFNNRITYANEAVYRMLGWSQMDILGRPLASFLHETMLRNMAEEMNEAAQNGRPWRGELRMRHREGYPIILETSGLPYQEQSGEVNGFIISLRRVGEERAIERMKARFMTLIAHEVGTPLMNLKLHLHLLTRSIEDPEQSQTYLNVLQQQALRLDQVWEKVLSATRLADSGALSMTDAINFYSLLDALQVRYNETAAAQSVQMVFAPPDPDLPQVYGDYEWLTRACNELVENALKYTPPGGQVTLEVKPFLIGQWRYLGVYIRDTGPGIDAEDIARLNASFMRIGEQETGVTPGIGLGLSIVRSVAERHGGGLFVESQPGHGSTFVLYLPVRDDAA